MVAANLEQIIREASLNTAAAFFLSRNFPMNLNGPSPRTLEKHRIQIGTFLQKKETNMLKHSISLCSVYYRCYEHTVVLAQKIHVKFRNRSWFVLKQLFWSPQKGLKMSHLVFLPQSSQIEPSFPQKYPVVSCSQMSTHSLKLLWHPLKTHWSES